MKQIILIVILSSFIFSCSDVKKSQTWPQFRGINGSGVADESSNPPVDFEKSNLIWKIDILPGSSSPVIWGKKLFITGYNEETKELQTMCINRKNGEILWSAVVKPDTLEKYHPVSYPAMGSVATDGERIVTFFGSCGIYCYNMNGSLLWKYVMPANKYTYGNGASPVIYNDKVIFLHDHWDGRYLLALNKNTGAEVWKTNLEDLYVPSLGSHSMPVIKDSLIYIHRPGEIACFSFNDGSPVWNFRLLTAGVTSPIISGKNLVIACWYNFSEKDQREDLPNPEDFMKKYDVNKNGTVNSTELPDDFLLMKRPEISYLEGTSHSVKEIFWAFDTNNDQEITKQEWQDGLKMLNDYYYKPAGLIAIKLKNIGQLSEKDIQWRVPENTPEVPSPICYNNRVYMIKDGGTLTCADAETGKVYYQERIANPGPQLASPIAANGFIYIFGYNGKAKIIKSSDTLKIAYEYDFHEKITATPAIIGNVIYIRTNKELLAYTN